MMRACAGTVYSGALAPESTLKCSKPNNSLNPTEFSAGAPKSAG